MKMHTGKYSFLRPYLHVKCISMLNWIVSLHDIVMTLNHIVDMLLPEHNDDQV